MGSDEVGKGMEKEKKEKQCSLNWENILELRVRVYEEKTKIVRKKQRKIEVQTVEEI